MSELEHETRIYSSEQGRKRLEIPGRNLAVGSFSFDSHDAVLEVCLYLISRSSPCRSYSWDLFFFEISRQEKRGRLYVRRRLSRFIGNASLYFTPGSTRWFDSSSFLRLCAFCRQTLDLSRISLSSGRYRTKFFSQHTRCSFRLRDRCDPPSPPPRLERSVVQRRSGLDTPVRRSMGFCGGETVNETARHRLRGFRRTKRKNKVRKVFDPGTRRKKMNFRRAKMPKRKRSLVARDTSLDTRRTQVQAIPCEQRR